MRCFLTIRSAWPLAPDVDDHGLGTAQTVRESAAKSLVATVSAQPACKKNKISIGFARQLLGPIGFSLACLSKTAESLGQIAAIISWKGTAQLWTTYFVLDDFLDGDLKFADSSWSFLGTVREILPAPWPATVARILSRLQRSQRLADEGQSTRQRLSLDLLRCHDAFPDTASTTGSETSAADSDASYTNSASSSYSARTPTGVITPANVSVVGTDADDFESRDFISSVAATPCRRSPARDIESRLRNTTAYVPDEEQITPPASEIDDHSHDEDEVVKERWIWDKDQERFHLSGRAETDPGYWYPHATEFA